MKFYGMTEVIGTLRPENGNLKIATNQKAYDVRGPLALELPSNTTGLAVLLHRFGYVQLVALGDARLKPSFYYTPLFCSLILVGIAAIVLWVGLQGNWVIASLGVAGGALGVTDAYFLIKAIQKIKEIGRLAS